MRKTLCCCLLLAITCKIPIFAQSHDSDDELQQAKVWTAIILNWNGPPIPIFWST